MASPTHEGCSTATNGFSRAILIPELLTNVFRFYQCEFQEYEYYELPPYTKDVSWITGITHVCVYWRAVALSIPHLWTDILISGHPTCKDKVRSFLSRSATLPLNILCWDLLPNTSEDHVSRPDPDISYLPQVPWFSWLNNDLNRIALLKVTPGALLLLPEIPSAPFWPLLQHFCITGGYNSASDGTVTRKLIDSISSSVIHSAPQLSVLMVPQLPQTFKKSETVGNLRFLTLYGDCEDVSDLLLAIVHVKDHLVELDLKMDGFSLATNPPISFPRLQKLSLYFGSHGPEAIAVILPTFYLESCPAYIHIDSRVSTVSDLHSTIEAVEIMWSRFCAHEDAEGGPSMIRLYWRISESPWDSSNLHATYQGASILLSLTLTLRPGLVDEAIEILNVIRARPQSNLVIHLVSSLSLQPPCSKAQWWRNLFQAHGEERRVIHILMRDVPLSAPIEALFDEPLDDDSSGNAVCCPVLEELLFRNLSTQDSEDLKEILLLVHDQAKTRTGLKSVYFENFGEVDEQFLAELQTSVEIKVGRQAEYGS